MSGATDGRAPGGAPARVRGADAAFEPAAEAPEHVDVLIVGAGLSGVGAAHHLQRRCPERTYAILEARERIGGTWDLFRYPGIRSDSDMYTLGYSFRPWDDARSIADGPSILRYVREAAADGGIDGHVRFRHRVLRADFATAEGRWHVHAQRTDTGEDVRMTCGFLLLCGGYYRYDEGYTPEFTGSQRFAGRIVHPQHWDESLDYRGKHVVVIGSGATAVTLVPAMAREAAHVTMLQRSPTYIVSLPAEDPVALALRRRLPVRLAYPLTRWKNVLLGALTFKLSRSRPRLVRAAIRRALRRQLPPDYDVDLHFNPSYGPWDQRMCMVPDGDLFAAIRKGSASIVTDRIASFTEHGIKLASGRELAADVVVTATGLNLQALGGVRLALDGEDVDIAQTLAYKGMMLSGIPNMAFVVGYTNASWTLKADLVCEYVCRLLNHMRRHGHTTCVARNVDPAVEAQPMIDFSSGYVQRAIHAFPKQGSLAPWRLHQNYPRDVLSLRYGSVQDAAMEFSSARAAHDARQPVLI